MTTEREDVLVIRVTRPTGLDFNATGWLDAEEKGERYGAMQEVAVETAESCFAEELSAAWQAVAPIAAEVCDGRRLLGGQQWLSATPPEDAHA